MEVVRKTIALALVVDLEAAVDTHSLFPVHYRFLSPRPASVVPLMSWLTNFLEPLVTYPSQTIVAVLSLLLSQEAPKELIWFHTYSSFPSLYNSSPTSSKWAGSVIPVHMVTPLLSWWSLDTRSPIDVHKAEGLASFIGILAVPPDKSMLPLGNKIPKSAKSPVVETGSTKLPANHWEWQYVWSFCFYSLAPRPPSSLYWGYNAKWKSLIQCIDCFLEDSTQSPEYCL